MAVASLSTKIDHTIKVNSKKDSWSHKIAFFTSATLKIKEKRGKSMLKRERRVECPLSI